MKVEKKSVQVVVTPPPTYDITGLTEMDIAVLRSLASTRGFIVAAVAKTNSFVRARQGETMSTLARLYDAILKVEDRAVSQLAADYETGRDRGDETGS